MENDDAEEGRFMGWSRRIGRVRSAELVAALSHYSNFFLRDRTIPLALFYTVASPRQGRMRYSTSQPMTNELGYSARTSRSLSCARFTLSTRPTSTRQDSGVPPLATAGR